MSSVEYTKQLRNSRFVPDNAKERLAYIFLAPLLAFLVFVVWVPFLQGVWMSFHNWPLGFATPNFVGLENYRSLLTSDRFFVSLKATVIYGFSTVIQLCIALAAALIVKRVRFKSLFSGMYLLPYTMPPVATGTLWLFLLKPDLGPVFTYLTNSGVLSEPLYWANSGDLALVVVTLVSAWTFWPFMFLILFATLVGIPDEYYETAQVYGANRWQTFRHITLPQLKTSILVVVTLRLVWNLTKVSQPLQMTGGGPGYQTSPLSLLLYRSAFSDGNLGEAFAVGIIFLLLVLAFIVLFIRYFEQSEGDHA